MPVTLLLGNLWNLNQQSIETDATGWVALTNCTIAQNLTQFLDGAASLAATNTLAGRMEVLGTGGNQPAVTAGASYYMAVYTRAATVARVSSCFIQWYNGVTFVSEDSTTAGSLTTPVVDTTTGWTLVTATKTAPATATPPPDPVSIGTVSPSAKSTTLM